MYDPGRQSSGGNKMHPGAQLSRRERAAMERMLALEHGGAPPIAMPPPELLPRRPPSFVDPTPREPPAVVPTVPRRDTASNPGHALRSVALPRHHRDDDDDDELNDAVALALRGADAEAELRWLRTERDALRAQVAHWRDASERHERALAERDTHTRQRLRKLGLWRLMGRLGLDARTNPQSRRALAQWLHACRERLRRAGRGGLEVSAPSPARARGFHRRVTGASPGLRGRPPEDDATLPDRRRRRSRATTSRTRTRTTASPGRTGGGTPGRSTRSDASRRVITAGETVHRRTRTACGASPTRSSTTTTPTEEEDPEEGTIPSLSCPTARWRRP